MITTTKSLKNGLEIVRYAVGKGLPILQSVQIHADQNGIYLRTTNLDTFIKTTINGTGEGEFCVDHKELSKAVRGLSAGIVTLDVIDGQVKINGELTLPCTPNEDFPLKQPLCKADYYKIDIGKLGVLAQSASIDKRRHPVLNGVLIGDGVAVATDGRALVISPIDKAIPPMVIGAAAIKIAAKVLDASAEIQDSGGYMVTIKDGKTEIVTWKIEGHYPKWKGIIPEKKTRITKINRAQWLETIGNILPIVHKIDKNMNSIVIESLENGFEFTSHGEGEFLIKIESENCFEAGYRVAANARLIMDALTVCDGEVVTMVSNTPNTPIYFVGETAKALVMPMYL